MCTCIGSSFLCDLGVATRKSEFDFRQKPLLNQNCFPLSIRNRFIQSFEKSIEYNNNRAHLPRHVVGIKRVMVIILFGNKIFLQMFLYECFLSDDVSTFLILYNS